MPMYILNECNKVQNPRRHVCEPLKMHAHACFPQKIANHMHAFNGARSLQRSDFREKPTKFLTSVAH